MIRATGVAFTRDPATGENYFYGEYLTNAQGEDVVAGIRTPQPINRAKKVPKGMLTLEEEMPKIYKQLVGIRNKLEKHYKRHAGHRVHHPAGQAVDAADPHGQAHRGLPSRSRWTWLKRASSKRTRP
jgi:hypothetical protein